MFRSPLTEHEQERDRLSSLDRSLAETLELDTLGAWTNRDVRADLATDNTIQNDVALLRSRYLARMGELVCQTWRTPPTGARFQYPGSDETYQFCYDRQHSPEILQRRAQSFELSLGRPKEVLLCANGMAAINVILQSLAYVMDDRPAEIGAFASYFETHSLLRLSAFAGRWSRVTRADKLVDATRRGAFSVLYVEPVQYNWTLDTTPWTELLAAINEAPAPPIVIIDTTLSGQTDAVAQQMAKLAVSRCPLLVRVRSGLKLDQEGLELANLGVLEWWPRADKEESFQKLATIANAFRTVSGAGLGRDATWFLSPGFVFDPSRLQAYSEGVFRSNAALYGAVDLTGDLFTSKVYPEEPWGSPFVLFKLRQDGREAYLRLAALLAQEARRRGLDWIMSGSFGFRTERFETIIPLEQLRYGEEPTGVLKVACGRYLGARFWAIVDLLNEIAAFDTLDEAETAWTRSGCRS